MVLAKEEGQLLPVLLLGAAAWLTLTAAHATSWDLHGHYDEDNVENGALAEPEGKVRTHGVVSEVVDEHFQRNEHRIDVEHVPVEPAPLNLIFGRFLLCLVDYYPLKNLMGNIQYPRQNLPRQRTVNAPFIRHLSPLRPFRVGDKSVSVTNNAWFVFEALDAIFPVKANLAPRVRPYAKAEEERNCCLD